MKTCGPLSKILVAAGVVVVFASSLSASQARTTAPAAPAATVYFFHGVPEDQANKAVAFATFSHPPAGSLTFDQSSTFDATPVAQSAACANSEFVPNNLAAYWTGPFTGTINGTLTLDFYWQISNPAGQTLGVVMNIKVVADPDFANPGVGTQDVIGNVTTAFVFTDALPKRFIVPVEVNGTVNSELLIQAASVVQLVCAIELGLTALYDNAATPSKFSFGPTAATIVSFGAKATGRAGVKLIWRTASEVDALGYNVWRLGPSRKPVKVNRTFVAAKAAGSAGGARYQLLDPGVRPGEYTYRLQVVNTDGTRTWRGSTTVRVR